VAPFYEGKPLLENLALNLRVRTVGDSFMVQNNLAPELHMIFDLTVRGTLAEPRIAGDVRPTDGQFRIFGLRGEFTLIPNVNHVTFVDTKSIAAGETPELNLEAEGPGHRFHQPRTQRPHAHQRAGGAGADRAGGQRPRPQPGAAAAGVRPHRDQETSLGGGRNPTLSADVSTGTDVIDQLARDSVADFLEPYIDDTMQLLTGGRLNLRPTVGRRVRGAHGLPPGSHLRLPAEPAAGPGEPPPVPGRVPLVARPTTSPRSAGVNGQLHAPGRHRGRRFHRAAGTERGLSHPVVLPVA
jgi:hypothetical protein